MFNINQFKQLEDFITNYDPNNNFYKDILFIEDQISFLVENLLHMIKIRPFSFDI